MNIAIRIVAGLFGLFGAFMLAFFWLGADGAANSMGLIATEATGLAAARADIGGFFGTFGFFALLTAWKGRAEFALPPMVLMSFALLGRIVSVLFGDVNGSVVSGMVIEAVIIAVFALAWRTLRTEAA